MFDIKTPKPPAILIDGVESNQEHSDTLQIPDSSERTAAKIGDYVKIGIESVEIGHEKFWVEILARVENGNYVGRVDNDIANGWGFNDNDHVLFAPRHVLATQ